MKKYEIIYYKHNELYELSNQILDGIKKRLKIDIEKFTILFIKKRLAIYFEGYEMENSLEKVLSAQSFIS